MSDRHDNPFDQLGVDPRRTPRELTELLRQRAERAQPEERKRLQNLWRQLTLKEADRLRWALLAHPRSGGDHVRELDELRRKLPPFLMRGTLPELEVHTADLLATPSAASDRLPISPPSMLDRLDE